MADIRHIPATASTNDDVRALARAGEPEGVWLRADAQHAGRGRQGRAWVSPPGNLIASTLIRLQPGDPPAHTLALVAAIALHETAAGWAPDAPLRIKWPNDLLLAGIKLAGILLERTDDAVIAGFGVNLAHAPPGLDRPATTLAAADIAPPPPDLFCADLAASFARWLARWRGEGLPPILDRWRAHAHPSGTALRVGLPDGTTVYGLFEGLDEDGALRLRLGSGELVSVTAGDVFLI